MLDKEFVDSIAELAKASAEGITVGGRAFVKHKGSVTDPEALVFRPQPAEVGLATLAGLLDFVKAHQAPVPGLRAYQILGLNVMSPEHVAAMTDLDGGAARSYPASAYYTPNVFIGKALTQEQAIIALMTECELTPSRTELVSMLSRIVSEEEFSREDDGISSKVTARTGVSAKGEIKVKPFHELKVRLTFPEIVQPNRTLLLRLAKRQTDFTVTFHEADGSGWKLQTVADIKAFLATGLEQRGVTLPVFA